MECSWDAALLRRGDELPQELLEVVRHGSSERYLETITKAVLDCRYTYTLFAHCEELFPHFCATLRTHGSLASSIATLGKVIPFAPYLTPFAERLLATETYDFNAPGSTEDDLLYLLGLFRLLSNDLRTFKQYVDPSRISELLRSPDRAIVYLAIRILQLYLQGADCWFETMVKKYLGADSPDSGIEGLWDGIMIDYRFLTLWEEERRGRVAKLMHEAGDVTHHTNEATARILPASCFDSSVALVGGVLLPRSSLAGVSAATNDLVIETPTANRNLKAIATGLKASRTLLLTGLPGSGKTLLLRHVANKLGKLDQMLTLHLNEQSDAKLLIGIYTTGDTPGSFEWKPGVLTTAVQEGRWVVIEDLDRAPNEVLGTLLPLIEKGELHIANRKQTIRAAQGFRIVATVRTSINHRGDESVPLGSMLGARHWERVRIDTPELTEQREIASKLFPSLHALLPQFLSVYKCLQDKPRSTLASRESTRVLRPISPRDLFKWCARVVKLLRQRTTFTSSDLDNIFLEAIDCFIGALPFGAARSSMAALISEGLHIDPQRRDYLLSERDVRYAVDKGQITVGRYSLPRATNSRKAGGTEGTFSTNPHTARMLERVAAATVNQEPLLLVGETGVGKTTAVQHLANHLGKKLVPFNLSQQSEAGDLLGGFKPVNARSLIIPMKDEFDDLFHASFSMSKNQDFLELLAKQMAKSNWKAVCKLWQKALKMVDQQRSASASTNGETPSKKRKIETKRSIDFARWDTFSANVYDIEKRLAAGNESIAFSFVEGSIVKAVRNGDWILLDEINLASMDTLESVADLLDPTSPSILLTEAGNVERIEGHPEFRVFAAMNPATDVGKKDLPPGIRSRFTELYVESPDKDLRSLQSIVRTYLRHETATDQSVPRDVSHLHQKIIALGEENKLVDGAGQRPHFSLRTLTRTLSYAKYIAPLCNLRRALYEGFQMSYLTFLDVESARLVRPLLEQHLFDKRTNIRAELHKALRKPSDGHDYVRGWPDSKHWMRRGSLALEEQPQYILTPFIRSNIENLVRATSTRRFPVLIQGPTSSGKTSMIEYLAKRTGHRFVRINNHEHTDLQEYLGTYVSGTDGKLQFQEGILVKALRDGHWIVLDELNLAPTDVLEALNRLLDDNRELLIPETQEVVRPHENFMLFATQNPAGLYGGRKILSRAFRNRFLELHFDDIPVEELQEILHRRTQLPESRCKRIVTVYRELSVLRQEGRLFEQKSFATLRDLFRWALRPNDTIEQLAANGFMLLAERVRKLEERQALKDIIERAMSTGGPKVRIDEAALYSRDCDEISRHQQNAHSQSVVWTKAMRRLYVLVSRAITNNEPVLLVGETGCGKTTVCQMLADAFSKDLHTVNAHQNTETGDLIGSQRPVRNRAAIETSLRHQLLTCPLIRSSEVTDPRSTEVLLRVYDDNFAKMQGSNKASYADSGSHSKIQADRARFKALFEWADGSLVQAMKSGAFFLLDEISLADDSVLERINSVLEPQRTILLAEKGSLDSFVSASPDFQFFATMNPGGDYGKRELSPALRNRFTEIWVPSLNDVEDVMEIVTAKLKAEAKPLAGAIVAFVQWFKERYNTSASSSISIRDTLAWVSFVNINAARDVQAAVLHGAAMVYIDTLGANPAGLMTLTKYSLDQERLACLDELSRLLRVDARAIYSADIEVRTTNDQFVAGAFSIPRAQTTNADGSTFSFEPPTTKANTMRVTKALQLAKPVMLEGNPGVGKTALVTAIASAVGVPLTRINLSEQTDLIDLFGSDVPVEGAETGSFTWRDAPFLRAMKNGEWVLLDEMNLASQSVLEGLNACLDHRGEVFVPELGQTFTRHPDFRLFAAQNPHHQGGGRKGLPASFVNRFTVVYADAFRLDDLMLICQRRFPSVSEHLTAKAVDFVEKMDYEVTHRKSLGSNGGPWEFNLRDVSRWLALASSDQGLLQAGSARDFVDFLLRQRFRSPSDKAVVSELFERVFEDASPRNDLFPSISPQALQLGLGLLPRNPDEVPSPASMPGRTRSHHARALESLMLCIQNSWPVILTGSSGVGKTSLIERLAPAVGAPVMTIAMNAETDAMDLVGGYEQFDPYRQTSQLLEELQHRLLVELRQSLANDNKPVSAEVAAALQHYLDSRSDLNPLIKALNESGSAELTELARRLQASSLTIDKARFEWIDGLLVDALQEGKWLILDNANLCSSSVLDRLNSLLEPNGSLIVNEHSTDEGAARIIRPHPSFRIFLTLDPRYGELSRAMRNRAVELHLCKEEAEAVQPLLDPLATESAVARLRSFKAASMNSDEISAEHAAATLEDHMSAGDQSLLARFKRQLERGLYCGAQLPGLPRINLEDGVVQRTHRFDATMISQLQGPADFANVQTLHPLNNQPLICTSSNALAQASSLAVSFDLRVELAFMNQMLEAAESDQSLLTRLRRLERSWGGLKHAGSRDGKGSETVRSLRQILSCLAAFCEGSETIPHEELRSVRLLFGNLCAIWNAMYSSVSQVQADQASITAFLAIATKLLQAPPGTQPSSLSTLRSQLSTAFNGLLSNAGGTTGLACAVLWEALRPRTPPTLDQLKEMLGFEALTARFDTLCFTSQIPAQEAVGLRLQLVQALRLARNGGRALPELTAKLESFGLAIDTTETEDHSMRHFTPTFGRILERVAHAPKDRQVLEEADLTKLELSAQLPTTQSTLADASKLGFLRRSSSNQTLTSSYEGASQVIGKANIIQRLSTANQEPLAELERLIADTQLLGRVLSSQAHVFSASELDSLDKCFDTVLSDTLQALCGSDNEHMRATATEMLRTKDNSLTTGPKAASSSVARHVSPANPESWVAQPLRGVVHYLQAQPNEPSRTASAASAWMSFALVALHLYVPSKTFDPALESLLKLDVHRRQRQDLDAKLQALRSLRAALVGESQSLRARILDEDIAALGAEPEAVLVCRPKVSELPQLQSEFDALLRALQPAVEDLRSARPLCALDTTTSANLTKVQSRLRIQYRAYDDLTHPVVLFIDCLLIGNELALQSRTSDQAGSAVERVIPFGDATAEGWLDDNTFVEVAATLSSVDHEITWLRAVAVRCSVRPLQDCSQGLRLRVEEAFQKFYAAWRAELSEDQKKNAAKSSLYKYKGAEEDMDETSQDDLDALFPTDPADGGKPQSRHAMQERAATIASLHWMSYGTGSEDAADVLRKWLPTSLSDPLADSGRHLVPATLFALGDLNASLSTAEGAGNEYNMYTDSNLGEAKKLYQLLQRVSRRFEELQNAWPEHATPGDVLVIYNQIMALSHASPLPRFFPLLEKLHGTVTEWQKIASREFSAAGILEDLTTMIISWRQLELSAWAGVLNREWEQCEKTAASWWFVAYETIIATAGDDDSSTTEIDVHILDLVKTLSGFIGASGLGEYSARLQLLRGFLAELTVTRRESHFGRALHNALANFIAYYARFEGSVAETLGKGREKLEKEAKNVIQVASWKDRNIATLRQSAQSSHRKLLRLVKKDRGLLSQPVTGILQAGLPTQTQESASATTFLWDRSNNAATPDTITGLESWDQRADRFRNASTTAELVRSKMLSVNDNFDGKDRLQDFCAELEKDIASLQKATPSLLKEDNKGLVNHLKTRKRRLFADVLKEVRGMGFQTSMNMQTLASQASAEDILARLPAAPQSLPECSTEVNAINLYRLADTMTHVRQAARSHSEDLTPAEASRSSSLLESMLHHCILQHSDLSASTSAVLALQEVVRQCTNLASSQGPHRNEEDPMREMQEAIAICLPVFVICIETLKHQLSMTGIEATEFVASLDSLRSRAQRLHEEIGLLPALPPRIESADHMAMRKAWEQLRLEIGQTVRDGAVQHPETEPVTAHLLRWVHPNERRVDHTTLNGHAHIDKATWTSSMLATVDVMLRGIQEVEQTAPARESEDAWVVNEQKRLGRAMGSFHIPRVTAQLRELLSQVQSLDESSTGGLSETASMCRGLLPILNAYSQAVTNNVRLQSSHQAQVSTTAHSLAKIFTTLCGKGFCTPSDKKDSNDASEGNVESGTGLGEGEGAEDISKNIAPDEDLSELAQDAKRENRDGEMEEEKDAVDMADEDMEGEMGDTGEAEEDQDGNASGSEGEEGGELDEEQRDVDDLGPSAVDEKMWDGGKDDKQREKESDAAKGQTNDDDVAAGKEGSANEDGEEQHEDDDEAAAGANDTEEVQQETAEQMDPHARDEENLDLPEDMAMDDKKGVESDGSDLESIADDGDALPDAASEGDVDDTKQDGVDQAEEAQAEEEEESENAMKSGETEANDDDANSDVLMQDDEPATADPQADAMTAPDTGSGADQAEDDKEDGGKGASSGRPADEEKPQHEEDEHEQAETGAGADDEAPSGGGEGAQEDKLPFKQIGDALHEWYKQNADIEQARQQYESQNSMQKEQPINTKFEHLPNEDTEADAQALGTANAEQSMALDDEQAMPVNDEKEPTEMPFQEMPEDDHEDPEGQANDAMQVEPSDKLRQEPQSNAFVGQPNEGDVEMADDGPTADEDDEVDEVDQQLLDTHISHDEASEEQSIDEARKLWSTHEESTRNLSLVLTEHLRLILQPTQATKMRGDFRTGKRLNIKRIIPYIASSYKRDKIWMRRSVPSKRAYQVMLAIDDSKSMMESESRHLAFETLAMVTKSLSMLEVGELSVVGFGEEVKIAHDFGTPFTPDAGAEIFKRLTFTQNKTNVRKLLTESTELFRSARLKASSSASDLWQLQLIVSDGICEDHPSIRQLVRQAHEERIMIVFIVVDAAAQSKAVDNGAKQSILDLQTAEFAKDASGEMQLKMVKYLDTFPFRYYLIVRDVQELPGVLAGALRQWFAEVVETSG